MSESGERQPFRLIVRPRMQGERGQVNCGTTRAPPASLLAGLMVHTGRWSVGAGSQASLLWPSTPGMWLMAAEKAVCMCASCSMRHDNLWKGGMKKKRKQGKSKEARPLSCSNKPVVIPGGVSVPDVSCLSRSLAKSYHASNLFSPPVPENVNVNFCNSECEPSRRRLG